MREVTLRFSDSEYERLVRLVNARNAGRYRNSPTTPMEYMLTAIHEKVRADLALEYPSGDSPAEEE